MIIPIVETQKRRFSGVKATVQSHTTLTQALMTPEPVTRGLRRRGVCAAWGGCLTLGFQLLFLLPSPCVVVIFRQLFCHGLGEDAKGQSPHSEDVFLSQQTPPVPE